MACADPQGESLSPPALSPMLRNRMAGLMISRAFAQAAPFSLPEYL